MKLAISFGLGLTAACLVLLVNVSVIARIIPSGKSALASVRVSDNPVTELKCRISALEDQILQAKDAGRDVTALERQLSDLYAQQTRPTFPRALDIEGGNNCADAYDLTGTALPFEVIGTTVGHASNYSCVGLGVSAPACWTGGYTESLACHGPSATYQFTVPSAGQYEISLCNLGTNYDSGLLIYHWTCPTEPVNPGDYICGNDDAPGCGLTSALTTPNLTVGTAILIVVSGYGDASGNFGLTVDRVGVTRSYNDLCLDAQPVTPNDTTVWDYTTTNSTEDNAPACDQVDVTAPGNWYLVVGTGDTLTATTCNAITDFDTKLSIYCGQCDNLTCVAANDDYDCPGTTGRTSTVKWCTEAGREYFILVHGFLSATGEYGLQVTDNQMTCTGAVACTFQTPPNDSCAHAVTLNVPSVTGGTTLGATVDVSVPDCDGVSATAPGVWYRVPGNGHWLVATTCHDSTQFDTKLSIYCGTCGDLTCVAADDDDFTCTTVNTLFSRVEWCTAVGQDYFILVHGYLQHAGQFMLNVFDADSACSNPVACNVQHPANDLCSNPQALSLPGSVIDATFAATVDTVPMCLDIPATAPGMWYSVTGNGHVLKATTCADTTDFDTKLLVFCGSCDSLHCVTAGDDDSDCLINSLQSTVRWCSETGREYRILVTGFLSQTGHFQLNVTDTDTACSDFASCGTEAAPPVNTIGVKEYALHQNYPNPFNPSTTIAFDLPKSGIVKFTVYNILGETVANLVNGPMDAGVHLVNFNAVNLPSGLYFYKLQAGDYTSIKKMMLLK